MVFDRRTVLQWALSSGMLGLASFWPSTLIAMVKPGMQRVTGDVRINGARAKIGDMVGPGDRVITGPDSEAAFVTGFDAYLMRSDGEIITPEREPIEKALTIVTGSLLSVFGKGEAKINTPYATIGIRGTGVYIEALPDRDYVCLCYGKADLKPKLDPSQAETLDTFHHDAPRNFFADPSAHSGQVVAPAKMVNHQDEELILLESLVGRIPLFGPKPIKMPK